jgi:uncharacterized membrane protein
VLFAEPHSTLLNKSQTRVYGIPRWVAVVCVLTALLFAGLEATHVHSGARSGNAGPCLVCVSAHSNAPVVSVTTISLSLTVEMVAIPYAIEANSITNLLDIFIRPPPSA